MILKCTCWNTTADAVYGRGLRPHGKLTTGRLDKHGVLHHDYMCGCCGYVRTEKAGRISGAKGRDCSDGCKFAEHHATVTVGPGGEVAMKVSRYERPRPTIRQSKYVLRRRTGKRLGATTKGA